MKWFKRQYNTSSIIQEMQTEKEAPPPPVYFPSNIDGLLIRNAVTGIPYPYRVGSQQSRALYCVHDTTGTVNAKGYRVKSTATMPNKVANRLYYDGPEQFFRHWRLPVDHDLVERWKEREQQVQVYCPGLTDICVYAMSYGR